MKEGSFSKSEFSSRALSARHLRIGWWSLLLFLSLGLALETLHGFKVGFYLDASNETRRLLWTLAHAHGTLLALVHVAFGLSVHTLALERAGGLRSASAFLTLAGIVLPLGFFLGGIRVYGGDPWPAVLLVPAGGLFLFLAVLFAARAVSKRSAAAP